MPMLAFLAAFVLLATPLAVTSSPAMAEMTGNQAIPVSYDVDDDDEADIDDDDDDDAADLDDDEVEDEDDDDRAELGADYERRVEA